MTGVERFAGELLRALNDALPDPQSYCVLAPVGTPRPDWLDRLSFREVSPGRGHFWEQVALYRAARDGILINLCNSGPVAHSRSLVVIHDAWVYRYPEHFSAPYRLFHQQLGRLLARRARLATVSRFSQGELAEVLHVEQERVAVLPNAADHLARIVPDARIIDRLGCTRGAYLLLVGSHALNKNMPRVMRAFASVRRDGDQLVMVGEPGGVFANDDLSKPQSGVIAAGRVTDGELAALYSHARLLLFPSLYEGFGIPPLEAMHFGIPVLASGIPVVREVCGDAAVYFDATREEAIADAIRQALDDPDALAAVAQNARERSAIYSWSASAAALQAIIDTL